jgi:hypothetical protein
MGWMSNFYKYLSLIVYIGAYAEDNFRTGRTIEIKDKTIDLNHKWVECQASVSSLAWLFIMVPMQKIILVQVAPFKWKATDTGFTHATSKSNFSLIVKLLSYRCATTLSTTTFSISINKCDNKHNDTHNNDTQNNDIQNNESQNNDTLHNDTLHNGTLHNDTQHNDA